MFALDSLMPNTEDNSDKKSKKLHIADIRSAHGIRGLVKIAIYLETPEDIQNYNPVHDDKGRAYTITLKNPIKGEWLAEVNSISDRNAAELLRGTALYIDRSQLPETDGDEIYLEDLVGCDAIDTEGHKIGEVISVDNFGASDLIEVKPLDGSKTYYLPIAEPYVQDINIEDGFVVIQPAEEFMA
jgi:16S rRNA processing protein RimM